VLDFPNAGSTQTINLPEHQIQNGITVSDQSMTFEKAGMYRIAYRITVSSPVPHARSSVFIGGAEIPASVSNGSTRRANIVMLSKVMERHCAAGEVLTLGLTGLEIGTTLVLGAALSVIMLNPSENTAIRSRIENRRPFSLFASE
jgi:hypothetical protein